MNVRRRPTRILGLAALAVLVGACGWGPLAVGPQPVLAGSPVAPTTASGTPGSGGVSSDGAISPNRITSLGRRAGFNPGSGILWMDDAERQQEMDAMVATGARWSVKPLPRGTGRPGS